VPGNLVQSLLGSPSWRLLQEKYENIEEFMPGRYFPDGGASLGPVTPESALRLVTFVQQVFKRRMRASGIWRKIVLTKSA